MLCYHHLEFLIILEQGVLRVILQWALEVVLACPVPESTSHHVLRKELQATQTPFDHELSRA